LRTIGFPLTQYLGKYQYLGQRLLIIHTSRSLNTASSLSPTHRLPVHSTAGSTDYTWGSSQLHHGGLLPATVRKTRIGLRSSNSSTRPASIGSITPMRLGISPNVGNTKAKLMQSSHTMHNAGDITEAAVECIHASVASFDSHAQPIS